MSTEHVVEVWHLASGSWGGACACGWVATVASQRADVVLAAEAHAPLLRVVDLDRDPGTVAPRSSTRHHVELRTTMEHAADGTPLFRARCACGWRSEPVGPEQVALLWEKHVDR